MPDSPFRTAHLAKPSFIQKIFHKTPWQNAIIELNNLLANTSLLNITPANVQEIEKKNKTRLYKTFNRNIIEFYASYLKFCLSDNKLSEDNLANIKHFKEILNLLTSS